MTLHDELERTARAIAALENAVAGLHRRLGPHLDVLRLIDGVASCAADLRRLQMQTPPGVSHHELVVISDDAYPAELWTTADVDTEGLGAPDRRAP